MPYRDIRLEGGVILPVMAILLSPSLAFARPAFALKENPEPLEDLVVGNDRQTEKPLPKWLNESRSRSLSEASKPATSTPFG